MGGAAAAGTSGARRPVQAVNSVNTVCAGRACCPVQASRPGRTRGAGGTNRTVICKLDGQGRRVAGAGAFFAVEHDVDATSCGGDDEATVRGIPAEPTLDCRSGIYEHITVHGSDGDSACHGCRRDRRRRQARHRSFSPNTVRHGNIDGARRREFVHEQDEGRFRHLIGCDATRQGAQIELNQRLAVVCPSDRKDSGCSVVHTAGGHDVAVLGKWDGLCKADDGERQEAPDKNPYHCVAH